LYLLLKLKLNLNILFTGYFFTGMAFASIADELAALGSDSEDDGIALPSFGDAPKKNKPTPKQVAFLLMFQLFSFLLRLFLHFLP
jgi:hypothetical protein